MNTGWQSFRLDWFCDAVKKSAAAQLQNNVFAPVTASNEDSVTFAREDGLSLEFTYLPETAPRYELRCLVSLVRNAAPSIDRLPLWFIEDSVGIPRDRPDRFSTPDDLRGRLDRMLVSLLHHPSCVCRMSHSRLLSLDACFRTK